MLDDGIQNFSSLLSESKLVVFGYDSAGFVEAMALNIPTLVFLQIGIGQLNQFSKERYEALLRVGIAHESPESLAKKMNEIDGRVEEWWAESRIQMVREYFCAMYARVSNSPIEDLVNIMQVT